jgi:GNAT superfamily N-acetyltransferase
MEPIIHIRPATATDLPRLQRIEADAAARFPPETLPPSAASHMPSEELSACLMSSLLWVAEAAGTGVVGFIAAQDERECLHIVEMDVSTSHGQRGIGTLLLRHACQVASDRGHRQVTLTTFEHLPWNAPFYARHGFTAVSDFAGFPHLAAALRREREAGLEQRVAMVAALGPRDHLIARRT